MFYGGAIGLGKYDGDFQYKMLFSIRMRGGTPTLSVFLYTSSFQFIKNTQVTIFHVVKQIKSKNF